MGWIISLLVIYFVLLVLMIKQKVNCYIVTVYGFIALYPCVNEAFYEKLVNLNTTSFLILIVAVLATLPFILICVKPTLRYNNGCERMNAIIPSAILTVIEDSILIYNAWSVNEDIFKSMHLNVIVSFIKPAIFIIFLVLFIWNITKGISYLSKKYLKRSAIIYLSGAFMLFFLKYKLWIFVAVATMYSIGYLIFAFIIAKKAKAPTK